MSSDIGMKEASVTQYVICQQALILAWHAQSNIILEDFHNRTSNYMEFFRRLRL